MTTAQKTEWDKPSHFIASSSCRFGKTTLVGDKIVSSVGDYRPMGESEPQPIGYNRTYETMVFQWNGKCCTDPLCNCGGIPMQASGQELDFAGANSEEECLANHARIVEKWQVQERK